MRRLFAFIAALLISCALYSATASHPRSIKEICAQDDDLTYCQFRISKLAGRHYSRMAAIAKLEKSQESPEWKKIDRELTAIARTPINRYKNVAQIGGPFPGPGTPHTASASPSYSFVVFDHASQVNGGNFTSNTLTAAGGTTGAHQLCIVGFGQNNGGNGTITNFQVNGSAAMTNVTGFGTLAQSAIFAGPCTIAATFTITFTCSACSFTDINSTVWVADNLVSTTPAAIVNNGNASTIQAAAAVGNFAFATAINPGACTLSWSTSAQAPAQTAFGAGPFNGSTAEADWIAASGGITAGNFVATITTSGCLTSVDAAMVVYH